MKGHIWDMPPMADQRDVWTYTISFLPHLSLEVYTSIQSLVVLPKAGANLHLPPPTPIPCHTHTHLLMPSAQVTTEFRLSNPEDTLGKEAQV